MDLEGAQGGLRGPKGAQSALEYAHSVLEGA